jgi:hypothetical protein
MEELDSVQTELEAKDDDLLELEKMYVANKEALVLERSEVTTLHKALTKEQEDHALTKKANVALNEKYSVLDEKHKELEMQYCLLWESTPQPSNAKNISTPSKSQKKAKVVENAIILI